VIPPPQQAKAVRFGPFELDLRTCCLTRGGLQERLAVQPTRLLAMLVERRGELVTREELRSQLWPGDTFGDFDHGLNNAVNRLREALGDSAASPRYIQTAPRRGYRFIADVELVAPAQVGETNVPLPGRSTSGLSTADDGGEAAAVPAIEQPDAPDTRDPAVMKGAGRTWFRPRGWILALIVPLIPVLALLIKLRMPRGDPAAPIRSLAVLPLQNLSGDPNEEYFADGVTDALITELAHTPNLAVVSRTSVMQVRGSSKSLRQIASELDVDAVVEGSVVRSGGRIRVTAQLIDARSDRHLWAQSFEEQITDVLTLQDKVAREIATQTAAALTPARESPAAPKIAPAAYDAYLRGLYFLHLRDATKSALYFRQAISLDPGYPAAYAGLADALASERVLASTTPPDTEAQALAAARRAVQLDPNSGEAYAALGFVEFTYMMDWSASGHDLEKGLALSPNNSFAQLQYSLYLDAVGRPEDAVTHMRQGLKLDPLSFVMNRHLGAVLYFARHYEESLIYLDHAAEMEPRNFRLVENWRSRSYEMLRQFDKAEQADLLNLTAWVPKEQLAPLRAAYELSGWKGYQEARIALLRNQPQLACGSFEIGEGYLRLGDRKHAFTWIDHGVGTSCFWYNWLEVDPLLDDLRSDPRFPALLTRIHLPASPVAGAKASRY
jgi:TolB-like protein/DNA-binding winged helix-turn-helix (wHTH) protein/Tfp pilus assembly protein PilF